MANMNLKGRAPGPGAISNNTDHAKFAAIWNSITPKEGEKASDLLLAAMKEAGIANEHTDIAQVRAFSTKVRDSGHELKSFRQEKPELNQKHLFKVWQNPKTSTVAEALAQYNELSGQTATEKDIVAKIKETRELLKGTPVQLKTRAGESDRTPRTWDKKLFCEIWQNCSNLDEAIEKLAKAGLLGSNKEKYEKIALSRAKEIRGLRKKVNGVYTNVGITKMQMKDGKSEKVTIEPLMPSLKKLKSTEKEVNKRNEVLETLKELGLLDGKSKEESEEESEEEDNDGLDDEEEETDDEESETVENEGETDDLFQ